MKQLLLLLGKLGEKTTRTDLWVLCAVAALIWAMINSDESVTLFILGYMFADLIGKEVADIYKVKQYAQTVRENQSGARPSTNLGSDSSAAVEQN